MSPAPALCATVPFSLDDAALLRWPMPQARTVEVGGVTVTCAEALRACEVLLANGACAIKAILAAARSPLAACDYHAVYKPGWEAARDRLKATGRPGGAGRHAAKHAFADAVREAVARSASQALEDALAAFSRDERYASAIAADASALSARRLRHAA